MRIIILIVLVISGLTAVACSSEAPSTEDSQAASRPTADVPATVEAGVSSTREAEAAIDATVEAKVAATLTTSTSTPGPTNTPAATTLPLDEYLTLCATTDIDLADDATYGALSSELAAEADRFEALTPPAQLSEWHLLNIEAYRTVQAVLDTQPMDDVIDFDNPTMNAAGDDFEEKLREAAARLPEDVLQRMIEAGCIDPDYVPDDYADLPDDHGNSEGDATAIGVGADVRGTLDYDDDIDYFRFQAEQGQSYQIDVTQGTLYDPKLDLFDSDGSFLDTNDDYGETYASRLYWEAPSSGERYVAVKGGTGTYTLTISLSTIVDDHGDSEGDATAIGVGAEVGGELEYDGDIDYFRFQAEAGWSYQIDVALGTLDDSIVELYDTDGSYLHSSDDYEGTYASRLSWRATSSGEKYVFVGGYGTGTYTLTVSLIDDHGNDYESATRIATGEAVAVELENFDDIDVLVFRARPGTEFLLTLDWKYYEFRENYTEPPLLAVYSANGQEQTRLMGYDFREIEVPSIGLVWRVTTGGEYYIVIGDGNTKGASAFSVTEAETTKPIAIPTEAPTPTPRPTSGVASRPVPVTTFPEVANNGSSRLAVVRKRGFLVCASRNDVPGFGYLDATGTFVGFDIDLCRAVATAVLGDPNAIEIRLITAAERGPTIQSGEVDLLVRTVARTASREAKWGNFVQTMFYNGQGFIVRKNSGITRALQLRNSTVCVNPGATTELNLQDFSNQYNLNIEQFTSEDIDAVAIAYETGQCHALTAARSYLAVLRSALNDPSAHTILPETISEEPTAPVVPHGDDHWLEIVKTVMAILIYGEAYGISQGSVPSAATGTSIVDRLLGTEGSFGQDNLGLSRTVGQTVLQAVGNYGEIYARNLGPGGINLPREGTLNALWADAPCRDCPKGGQIYAAPLR